MWTIGADILTHNVSTNAPHAWNECTFLHYSSFTAVFSRVSEGHGGMVLNRMYGEGEGNQPTQVHLEEWPFNRNACMFHDVKCAH